MENVPSRELDARILEKMAASKKEAPAPPVAPASAPLVSRPH
jgi:hypothetical protein